jgi:hypothetical protein
VREELGSSRTSNFLESFSKGGAPRAAASPDMVDEEEATEFLKREGTSVIL